MSKSKPVYTEFAPNMRREERKLADRFLCRPWLWSRAIQGEYPAQVDAWLQGYFDTPYAYTIDSGRSALAVALEALHIGAGDEVILQAYTCVVVPNAITAVGAVPIYVDITSDFTMNVSDLDQKIHARTKAIIVQHTFGQSADMEHIITLARTHNIPIIEDCAHALGSTRNGTKVGLFGDIAFFSFGRDKIVSCVRGGAIVTRSANLGKIIAARIAELPDMSRSMLAQHLAHFPAMAFGIRTYQYSIGKWFLWLTKITHMVSRAIIPQEKKGMVDVRYPTKLPNALAQILLLQLRDLGNIQRHRQTIAHIYDQLLQSPHITLPIFSKDDPDNVHAMLRYTIQVPHPGQVHRTAKHTGVYLGSWYDTPIAPKDTDLQTTQYVAGSCPVAESAAGHSLNLPTHLSVTPSDAAHIAAIVLGAA